MNIEKYFHRKSSNVCLFLEQAYYERQIRSFTARIILCFDWVPVNFSQIGVVSESTALQRAILSRMISLAFIISFLPERYGFLIFSLRRFQAAVQTCSGFESIVVSEVSAYFPVFMLSIPITETSLGTRRPAFLSSLIAPKAILSYAHITAVQLLPAAKRRRIPSAPHKEALSAFTTVSIPLSSRLCPLISIGTAFLREPTGFTLPALLRL